MGQTRYEFDVWQSVVGGTITDFTELTRIRWLAAPSSVYSVFPWSVSTVFEPHPMALDQQNRRPTVLINRKIHQSDELIDHQLTVAQPWTSSQHNYRPAMHCCVSRVLSQENQVSPGVNVCLLRVRSGARVPTQFWGFSAAYTPPR